jgi:hypothetical protein
LLGSTCPEELRKAMLILDEQFAIFNLSIDHSKTQLIRSNTELSDTINVIYNKESNLWENVTVQKRMKWLGF